MRSHCLAVVLAACGRAAPNTTPSNAASDVAIPRCSGIFIAESTRDRESGWNRAAIAEPVVHGSPLHADRMRGPFESPDAICGGNVVMQAGSYPIERYATLDGRCRGIALQTGSRWWFHGLADQRSEPPLLVDLDSRSPGAELAVRSSSHYAPVAPADWRPYTTESVTICGVGSSRTPSCIDQSLGDDSQLPQHRRIAIACSGDVDDTSWTVEKPAEGGGAILSHSATRLELP